MNVLSLFDGKSCGQIALDRCDIKVDKYFASEVDKYAIAVTQYNYPNTIQLGDVVDVDTKQLPKIDLLIGGSPCQYFSFAGKRKGMITKDEIEILSLEQYLKLKQDGFEFEGQSYLFWEYVRILAETKPKYFLLENVRMDKRWEEVISRTLGNVLGYTIGKGIFFGNRIEPIKINSALVSAQNRVRLYWTNIPNIIQPQDKGVVLKNIIETGEVDRDKSYCLDSNYFKKTNIKQYLDKNRRQIVFIVPENTKKAYIEISNGDFVDLNFINSKTRRGRLMKTKSHTLLSANSFYKIVNNNFRMLLPIECERLQTVSDNYTQYGNFNDEVKEISNTQRYKMLGNGWTVDVIVHIFNSLRRQFNVKD